MTYKPLTEHNAKCINAAEVKFRENCCDLLTAPAWDKEAIAAEHAYVSDWARIWLDDGTTNCECEVKH